jgi:WD40 repeat protein
MACSDLSVLFRNSEAHRGRVNDVAFYVDPDDNNIQWIVSGGADGDLKLWSIPAPGP